MSSAPTLFAEDLTAVDDSESIQAVLVAALIDGNAHVRAQLPPLMGALDEPYRTIAALAATHLAAGGFLDRVTLGSLLGGVRLHRQRPNGSPQPLTAAEAMNLVSTATVQPDRAASYLEVLQDRLHQRRRDEFQVQATGLVRDYATDPEGLKREIDRLVSQTKPTSLVTTRPTELLEIIPFMHELVEQQRGTEFLGLDSGFEHLNYLCNGLDTGLLVLAAPPGRGKTTLVWQICCQVVEREHLPVIFVSMEQSKRELRAKALARLSKLAVRHILRGRLRSSDDTDMAKLLSAAHSYALLGRHLTIIEGDENTTIDNIRQAVSAALDASSAKRCLLAVDYLQALPLRPEDAGRVKSTKDKIDLHVSALRRIGRDFDAPVIAISSENRASYESKQQMDVFKESGGIEYAADVAAILTRAQGGSPPAAEYQRLDLNIVKNRNGERGVVQFQFYPGRAEFIETGRDELAEEEEKGNRG